MQFEVSQAYFRTLLISVFIFFSYNINYVNLYCNWQALKPAITNKSRFIFLRISLRFFLKVLQKSQLDS